MPMLRAITGTVSLLSRRQKFGLLLLSLTAILFNALDVLAIGLLAVVASLALGGVRTFPDWWPIDEGAESLAAMTVLAALLFLAKTIIGVLLAKKRANFLSRLETHFSDKIARFIFSGDLLRMKSFSRPEMEWAIMRSSATALRYILGQSLQLLSEAALALSIVVLFLVFDWVSALLALAYFVAVIGIFQFSSRSLTSKSGAAVTSGDLDGGQTIEELVKAYREISVLGRLDFFLLRLKEARTRVSQGEAAQAYISSIPRLVVELALIIGALGFAAFQLFRGSGDPDFGTLAVFIAGSLRMMSALLPLQRAYVQLLFYRPQAVLAVDLIRTAISADQTPGTADQTVAHPPRGRQDRSPVSVDLEAVSFSYQPSPSEESGLQNITMSISAGSTVALVGRSGAGKSTLADVILGLHRPTSGKVSYSGFSPDELRSARAGILGYVPQKPGIIGGSVAENVALGLPTEEIDREQVWWAIESAGLGGFVSGLPSGLHTDLGKQADSLSGGQVQRIGLARALYGRPGLLVLDEATSALDLKTEKTVTETLERFDATKILIAHRFSTVKNAESVYVLESGRIAAKGTFSQVIAEAPWVQDFLETT